MNHQHKYMSIKLKIGLHLKLKKDIVLNDRDNKITWKS